MANRSKPKTFIVPLCCAMGIVSALLHWIVPTRLLLGNPAEYAIAAVAAALSLGALALLVFGFLLPCIREEKALGSEVKHQINNQASQHHVVSQQSIGLSIALSFLSFGIYSIYWEYLLVKSVKAVKKDESSCVKELLCLIFVPIYPIYWWYTRGKSVKDELTKQGYSPAGTEIVYLVFALLGLSIVSMAIMQNDFNALPAETDSKDAESIQISEKRSNGVFRVLIPVISCWSAIGLFIAACATVVKLMQAISYGFVPVQTEGAALFFSVLTLINVPVLWIFLILYILDQRQLKD
ncbi:MAG: DUF4234 domain-containing protein [Clostridia bacterium]|nr:DUF4234 domain-containing protein [Clostridia bacterium]